MKKQATPTKGVAKSSLSMGRLADMMRMPAHGSTHGRTAQVGMRRTYRTKYMPKASSGSLSGRTIWLGKLWGILLRRTKVTA